MEILQVGFCDLEIFFHHLHGGVTEDLLKAIGLSAVAEVVNGEGVAEAMGMDIGYSGAAAQ